MLGMFECGSHSFESLGWRGRESLGRVLSAHPSYVLCWVCIISPPAPQSSRSLVECVPPLVGGLLPLSLSMLSFLLFTFWVQRLSLSSRLHMRVICAELCVRRKVRRRGRLLAGFLRARVAHSCWCSWLGALARAQRAWRSIIVMGYRLVCRTGLVVVLCCASGAPLVCAERALLSQAPLVSKAV